MNEILADKIQFLGKRWLGRASLALAILLSAPTMAIMVTWNTLPGERLYPVKRYLEEIALKIVGGSFAARADLQAQFVEQRFNEAETLLVQSSGAGIAGLSQQIQIAKAEIVMAKSQGSTKEAVVAEKKAEKLVIQLKEYDQKLETTKTQLVPVQPIASPTAKPVVVSVETAKIEVQQPEEVVPQNHIAEVKQVQEEIKEAIVELERVRGERGQGEERRSDNKEDKDSKKDERKPKESESSHP